MALSYVDLRLIKERRFRRILNKMSKDQIFWSQWDHVFPNIGKGENIGEDK